VACSVVRLFAAWRAKETALATPEALDAALTNWLRRRSGQAAHGLPQVISLYASEAQGLQSI